MTLCIAWKDKTGVQFISDSRITLAKNSTADVCIKIISVPYSINSPSDSAGNKNVEFCGSLGMCFAGSAINSFVLKESILEVMQSLQYAPTYTDISMEGLVAFIYKAYCVISKKICETVLGENGIAEIIITGYCHDECKARTFKLSTNLLNQHSFDEVLLDNEYIMIGSGRAKAEEYLNRDKSEGRFFRAIKQVIDDATEDSVGGNIQYGKLESNNFKVFGIADHDEGVHYWRGALDMNQFISDDFPVSGLPCIDPFGKFK